MFRGFTIIECLISMLLLAIALVGSMAFFFCSSGNVGTALHRRIASEIANAKLEEIKSSDYDSLEATFATSSPCPNVALGHLTGTECIFFNSAPESPYNYKQVQVLITWQDPNRTQPQQVSLSTFVAKR